MTGTGELHSECGGQGPDLLLVHGWGMHSGLWGDFADTLAHRYRVTRVDLPGHGHSPMSDRFSVDSVSQMLLEVAPERAVWVGWSMGAALVCNCAALNPERVTGVVVIAGNPRFVRGEDWPDGLEPRLLREMASSLQHDCRGALLRFLAIQTAGQPAARRLFRSMQRSLLARDLAHPAALQAGLEILERTDLRPFLGRIRCPALMILGARDTLVPVACGAAVQALWPGLRLRVIDQAGHMPFVSHPHETLDCLIDWLPYVQ